MGGKSLKIILPLLTLSQNEYQRMHYIQQWKLGKQYMWELIAVGANAKEFKVKGPEKRKVTLYTYRRRLLDQANFIGGAKPLIDALQKMKLIYQDNLTYLDDYYVQIKSKVERTEIVIERI